MNVYCLLSSLNQPAFSVKDIQVTLDNSLSVSFMTGDAGHTQLNEDDHACTVYFSTFHCWGQRQVNPEQYLAVF